MSPIGPPTSGARSLLALKHCFSAEHYRTESVRAQSPVLRRLHLSRCPAKTNAKIQAEPNIDGFTGWGISHQHLTVVSAQPVVLDLALSHSSTGTTAVKAECGTDPHDLDRHRRVRSQSNLWLQVRLLRLLVPPFISCCLSVPKLFTAGSLSVSTLFAGSLLPPISSFPSSRLRTHAPKLRALKNKVGQHSHNRNSLQHGQGRGCPLCSHHVLGVMPYAMQCRDLPSAMCCMPRHGGFAPPYCMLSRLIGFSMPLTRLPRRRSASDSSSTLFAGSLLSQSPRFEAHNRSTPKKGENNCLKLQHGVREGEAHHAQLGGTCHMPCTMHCPGKLLASWGMSGAAKGPCTQPRTSRGVFGLGPFAETEYAQLLLAHVYILSFCADDDIL